MSQPGIESASEGGTRKLLYTTQFHPEYETGGDGGRRFLANFFKLARGKWGA
jgi:imidazoleglycerol phosphate synthase glutamine amidotransferase subunit HisH